MRFSDHLVVVRGGGDLGTGVVARLHRAGFPVAVLELPEPLAIRRRVAVAAAVLDGETVVEDVVARAVATVDEARAVASSGEVAVLVGADPASLRPEVLVDARMAKRNLGTSIDQAPLVVALGPGFTAGIDCHAVVETKRGHHLGRVLWEGRAAPDTGEPGMLGGKAAERVVRAPGDGVVAWHVEIGDDVTAGQPLGAVGDGVVAAPIDGVVRGLIQPGRDVTAGLKIGDVDPRGEPGASFEISDKALAVGGGVLEAVLTHLNR